MSKHRRGFLKAAPLPLMLFYFTYSFTSSIRWVIGAPFLRAIGFSPLEYGVLGSVMAFAGLLSTGISGWLVDRYGSKKIIYLSLAMTIASNLLFATGNYLLIYVSVVLLGLAGAMTWIPLDVLVSHIVSRELYHYAYPYLMSLSAFGGAVGSYTGWVPRIIIDYGLVGEVEAYRFSILLSTVLYVPCLVLVYRIKASIGKVGSNGQSVGGFKEFFSLPRGLTRTIVKLAVPEVLIGFGASLSIHNISYYFMLKFNVGSGGLGTLFGTEQLVMAALMLLLPRLRERIGGSLKTYVVLASTSIPLLVAITFLVNYYVAIALYITRTVLMNVASPLYTAFLMYIVPAEHRGKVSSLIGIARRIAIIPGRSLGGYLLEVDLELPLRLTALLYTIALGLLAVWFKREEK